MHFQRTDCRDDYHGVGLKVGHATLEVPELLVSDIGPESALSDMVVRQFGSESIGDNGALPDGDVGERSGMNEHGLAFEGLDEIRIDRVDQPCGHRAVNLEVSGGHFPALVVVGQDHVTDSIAEILQVRSDGQDRHHLTGDRHLEARVHLETIHLPAAPNANVTQGLGAEIHRPFDLNAIRIDVQPLKAAPGPNGRHRSSARAASGRSGPPSPGCGRW